MTALLNDDNRAFDPIEILRDLVAFDSTSRNSNLPITEYIRAKLETCHGIKTWLVSSPDGTKANLIAQIGPDTAGGILFSGHTDVVPVDGQNWDGNPFELSELPNGTLRGRGTTDMKGFVACVLSQAKLWSQLASQGTLIKPVYMVFSYDEEIGCKGVISAIDDLNQRGIKPDLCIVGEPTEMQVAVAHNARARVWVDVSATGGHAATHHQPDVTSATDLATLFHAKIITARHDFGPVFGHVTLGNATLAATGWEQANASNVIPSQAQVHFDFRGRPGTDPASLKEYLEAHAKATIDAYRADGKTTKAEIAIRTELMNPGFNCTDDAAIQLAAQFADNSRAITVPYVCEAARFWDAGFIQTVVMGPGNIKDAHQPNETLARGQIDKLLVALRRVTDYVTTPAATPAP